MITADQPSSFVRRQAEYLRKIGIEIDVFYFYGGKKPVNYLKAWLQVQKQINTERYDLIHAQFGQSAFPALLNRLPLVVTFRGSDVMGVVGPRGKYMWFGHILNAFSYLIALIADQAVVVSEALMQRLPKRKYHVITSGLDLDLFHPMDRLEARRSLGWQPDDKVVFFGGNAIAHEKRYPLACAAVKLLEEKFPLIKFVVAQNIEHKEMPIYINASDVVLLTSTHEGSPNVVKEALACNVPVVSTDVGDVRQRVGQIEGCIICADDQPDTISNALASVLNRDARISGRETVLELDESLLAQKMAAIYEQALTKRKTR